MGKGHGFTPLAGTGERGLGRAWVLSKGGEGAWAVHARLSIPVLPVPVPLLPCAIPMCLPSSSTIAPVPLSAISPQFCVCFLLCASFLWLLLAFTAAPPLQEEHPPAPSLLLPSMQPRSTAKSTGSCTVWQQAQPRELWHHLGTAAPSMLLLTQKAAVEATAPSAVGGRIQGCPAPLGAAGACILSLHPLAWLCLCQQLPEELTHFWLQQGRGCPAPLALLSLVSFTHL